MKFRLVLNPNVNPSQRLELTMRNGDFPLLIIHIARPHSSKARRFSGTPRRFRADSLLFSPGPILSSRLGLGWLLLMTHAIPKDWHPISIFTSVVYTKDTKKCSRLQLFGSVS